MGCDIRELEKWRDNVNKLSKELKDAYFEKCAKELAARLLAKVIKRTPVGVYPAGSGKVGGTLRRGWDANKASELRVKKRGGAYSRNTSPSPTTKRPSNGRGRSVTHGKK